MSTAGIVFPHQLFELSPFSKFPGTVFIVEETLFFRQFPFHKQKLAFHRACMKYYEEFLKNNGTEVIYIDSQNELSDIRKLIPYIQKNGYKLVKYIDVADDWLSARIRSASAGAGVIAEEIPSPMFLNDIEDIIAFFNKKPPFRQTDFYIIQRKKRKILLDIDEKPAGGKWTLDVENRSRYPAGRTPPEILFPPSNRYQKEASEYVLKYFRNNYGNINLSEFFPVTHDEAKAWLMKFLEERFYDFGKFQDAIKKDKNYLNHSLLSPLLNVGLITPETVLNKAIDYALVNEIPLNSLEGFIRQILGWREFIRGIYLARGSYQRTRNFWRFTRRIPESFWKGTTGIEPVDSAIKRLLNTGYNHHIERLMVIGNFMLLCEFDPSEVYNWFMTLYIDAYDWVMVPNVFGMSQFADGGLMSTKPYISGSSYLLRMGDYSKGNWQNIWDALFWRFLNVYRSFFMKNPRMSILIKNFDSMAETRKASLLDLAEKYLSSLD